MNRRGELAKEWDTRHEIEFLKELGNGRWLRNGSRNRPCLLAQYQEAMEKRKRWGKVDPEIIKAFLELEIGGKL